MGKTIIVKNLKICQTCPAILKFGCYLIVCNNVIRMEDNKLPNALAYKEENGILITEATLKTKRNKNENYT